MEVKKSKVSAKGLTTIPKEIRNLLNIVVGSELLWNIHGDQIIVQVKEKPAEFLKDRFDHISYDEAEELSDNLVNVEVDKSQ